MEEEGLGPRSARAVQAAFPSACGVCSVCKHSSPDMFSTQGSPGEDLHDNHDGDSAAWGKQERERPVW